MRNINRGWNSVDDLLTASLSSTVGWISHRSQRGRSLRGKSVIIATNDSINRRVDVVSHRSSRRLRRNRVGLIRNGQEVLPGEEVKEKATVLVPRGALVGRPAVVHYPIRRRRRRRAERGLCQRHGRQEEQKSIHSHVLMHGMDLQSLVRGRSDGRRHTRSSILRLRRVPVSVEEHCSLRASSAPSEVLPRRSQVSPRLPATQRLPRS